MSSSFAEEASLAEENSQDTAGSGSAPGAVLSASELIESVPPAKSWNVIPSMVDFEYPLVRCLSMLAGLLQRPISREARSEERRVGKGGVSPGGYGWGPI